MIRSKPEPAKLVALCDECGAHNAPIGMRWADAEGLEHSRCERCLRQWFEAERNDMMNRRTK
jgi:hypothetical protein